MKGRYYYHFDRLATLVEGLTGLKLAGDGRVIGFSYRSYLHEEFGTRGRRYYPFGCVVILPPQIPRLPIWELPEEGEQPAPPISFF